MGFALRTFFLFHVIIAQQINMTFNTQQITFLPL